MATSATPATPATPCFAWLCRVAKDVGFVSFAKRKGAEAKPTSFANDARLRHANFRACLARISTPATPATPCFAWLYRVAKHVGFVSFAKRKGAEAKPTYFAQSRSDKCETKSCYVRLRLAKPRRTKRKKSVVLLGDSCPKGSSLCMACPSEALPYHLRSSSRKTTFGIASLPHRQERSPSKKE